MADKELLREVALELWGSVKKLRPGLPRESRLELTLKALMVIGDPVSYTHLTLPTKRNV